MPAPTSFPAAWGPSRLLPSRSTSSTDPVRIAVSGSHGVGKSTLVADLARALPGYMVMVEPFVSLVEEGHSFADPPTVEDFEAQLERSIEMLGDAGADVLFERCPVDFLAYIAAHEDGGTFDLRAWLPRVRAAVSTLDLVAYAPLEAGRHRGFRARVDR